MPSWEDLASQSHYQTAVAVRDALGRGDAASANEGIEELIEALSRSERRALKSQLVRLMVHVIKWHTQPLQRSRSWVATIQNSRDEVFDIMQETPSLNRATVDQLWPACLQQATRQAEAEMDAPAATGTLTWQQVMADECGLP